jgi:hypothetical protein
MNEIIEKYKGKAIESTNGVKQLIVLESDWEALIQENDKLKDTLLKIAVDLLSPTNMKEELINHSSPLAHAIAYQLFLAGALQREE